MDGEWQVTEKLGGAANLRVLLEAVRAPCDAGAGTASGVCESGRRGGEGGDEDDGGGTHDDDYVNGKERSAKRVRWGREERVVKEDR